MRIYGTQKCKQYGTHGIQFPHDIDLHTKRKVSVPKQDIGLTVRKGLVYALLEEYCASKKVDYIIMNYTSTY